MFISYGLFCEGSSDAAYFNVLLPRVLEDIIVSRAAQNVGSVEFSEFPTFHYGGSGRAVESVADEICKTKDLVNIVFIHADTGGAGQEAKIGFRSLSYCTAIHELCDFPLERCVCIRVKQELEAWVLADAKAVGRALGYSGKLPIPGSIREIERLTNPKVKLREAIRLARGRRSRNDDVDGLLALIARSQQLSTLRRSKYFSDFYDETTSALISLRVVE